MKKNIFIPPILVLIFITAPLFAVGVNAQSVKNETTQKKVQDKKNTSKIQKTVKKPQTSKPQNIKQKVVKPATIGITREQILLNLQNFLASSPETSVSSTSTNWSSINLDSRKAIVNILCNSRNPKVGSITGTGIIVYPSGIILTNAHIAQYLLLKNYGFENSVDCVIRTGEPAQNKYRADLLYMPSQWVTENANKILDENPTGTGEFDFAFLKITSTINIKELLPENFHFIMPEMVISKVDKGKQTLVAGYAAQLLGGIVIQKFLNITSSIVDIKDIFTFKSKTLDVISLGGSAVAQKGSSGGAVVNENGKLIGLLVTTSEGATTADRNLNALSIDYINRQLQTDLGMSLPVFLESNLDDRGRTFTTATSLGLRDIVINALEGKRPTSQ